ANIEFPFLESGLWSTLDGLRLASANPAAGALPLNTNILSQMIMLVLLDDGESKDEYEPFRAYFIDNGVKSNVKLWQLCDRLAARFLEYQMHRFEMVEGWLKGVARFAENSDVTLAQLEKAQMTLYSAIFADGGRLSASRVPYQTLFQFADSVLDNVERNGIGDFSDRLRVFTPSRLSTRHRRLLLRLGRLINVGIYHLNICSEFWEDVSTPSEDKWRAHFRSLSVVRSAPEEAGDYLDAVFEELEEPPELENELLKEFGKPGREMLKIYSELEVESAALDVRFENSWLDAGSDGDSTPLDGADSLLRVVRDGVLTRSTPHSAAVPPPGMRSLQICASPSIHREVECVYNSILYNMAENPELRLSDIAVLVVDMKKYR
ncbi:MAG: exodeoxyribonuclease V subunit gamma, partial [Victivallales bacterium]|nr:exodeoxyribonuclease V subunit gamma [Victivallales bacterium]